MVRVRDILEMEILKQNKLLAGEAGLGNIVTGINIYEYTLKHTRDRTGELYLTSFYNIREGGEEALFEHIKVLIETNCPGLLMGAGTYADINDDIRALASQYNFPIISIGESPIYADVLKSAYKLILDSNAIDNNAIFLDRIMALTDDEIVLKYVHQINAAFVDPYRAVYVASDRGTNIIYCLLCDIFGGVKDHAIIKHGDGFLMIIGHTMPLQAAIDTFGERLPDPAIRYHFGISDVYSDYGKLVAAVTEARYAYETCLKITGKKQATIQQIGIYRLLIPICKDADVVAYAASVVKQVEAYDAEHSMDILETVQVYLRCENDIHLTAEKLFLHPNTIRYRLKKIATILDDTNKDCMEQLAMAIRVLRLNGDL